jgi:curli biogenesis system outer membrane secretion channel CsgG
MRARKACLFSALAGLGLLLAGCTTGYVTQGGPNMQDVQNQAYNGPKARIAVARFENKVEGNMWMSFQRDIARIMAQAQKAMAEAMKNLNRQQAGAQQAAWVNAWGSFSDPISSGIKEMLTTELVACNRFIVYERENLGDIMAEQQLSSSAAANPKAKIPAGQLEGVELFIYGALTEFEASKEGGEMTIPIPLFGQTVDANLGYNRSEVGMDLRIIDTRTGRIVAVTTVKGSATNVRLGGSSVSSSLPTTLQGYQNTPVEAACRKMIREAIKYIITKTPKEYYHFEK